MLVLYSFETNIIVLDDVYRLWSQRYVQKLRPNEWGLLYLLQIYNATLHFKLMEYRFAGNILISFAIWFNCEMNSPIRYVLDIKMDYLASI